MALRNIRKKFLATYAFLFFFMYICFKCTKNRIIIIDCRKSKLLNDMVEKDIFSTKAINEGTNNTLH